MQKFLFQPTENSPQTGFSQSSLECELRNQLLEQYSDALMVVSPSYRTANFSDMQQAIFERNQEPPFCHTYKSLEESGVSTKLTNNRGDWPNL